MCVFLQQAVCFIFEQLLCTLGIKCFSLKCGKCGKCGWVWGGGVSDTPPPPLNNAIFRKCLVGFN